MNLVLVNAISGKMQTLELSGEMPTAMVSPQQPIPNVYDRDKGYRYNILE